VTARKVLTAAHCVKSLSGAPALLNVTFGRADLTSGSGVTVGVKSVWVDPAFHETSFDGQTVEHDDVAVLTLTRAVDRATVPLVGAGATYPAGAATTVLGWGTTSSSDLFNTRLRSTTVNLTTAAACAAAYGSSFGAGDMVCAARTGHDTCEFDSGGPLMLHGRLAALTSWGNGCAKAGFPGVYARLSTSIPILRAQLR
jgi:secreted trypsin-like serine protease